MDPRLVDIIARAKRARDDVLTAHKHRSSAQQRLAVTIANGVAKEGRRRLRQYRLGGLTIDGELVEAPPRRIEGPSSEN